MRSRRAVALAAAAVMVAACGGAGATTASPSAPGAGELTVYAAASLDDALEAVAAAWEAAHPGTSITLSTGSSVALRTQIEQGAPADVFLAADTANPQALADEGLAEGDAVVFAGNTLAILVPSRSPATVASPADLAREGVRIVAAGEEVPLSRYVARVVANLAALPGYPADFAQRYEANVVSREEDAATVAAKVELGEGDAAFVYATDARTAEDVVTVGIPAEANVAATYAGVVVHGAADPVAARAFLDWLAGPDGRAVLGRFGFAPPP